MNKIIKLSLLSWALFLPIIALAQDKVEMADVLRSNGKIYAVVAVCITILVGLFLYLILLDRKIKKLEK
jgi:Kef-type K+ transport system membrane component KefB